MMRRSAGCLLALGAALAVTAHAATDHADVGATVGLIALKTNEFRAGNQRAKLAVNRPLSEAAQRFAQFMASTDQYGHQADGRQPADRAREQGYDYCAIAENIAYQFSSAGFTPEELAGRLMQEWEKSPGHRHNMLLPTVIDIGVGVARSPRTQRWYAVQMFGRQKSAATRFEIANRAEVAVQYELDAQRYTLPPRVSRTHEGCFSSALTMLWPNGPESPGFEPGNGAHYVVQRDHAGQLRLQARQQ